MPNRESKKPLDSVLRNNAANVARATAAAAGVTLLQQQLRSLIDQYGTHTVVGALPIMSVEQLATCMMRQAELRAPENDEAGCIHRAADAMRRDVNALESDAQQQSVEQRLDDIQDQLNSMADAIRGLQHQFGVDR